MSFLLHLLRPGQIPIIDQHNFRAMNHYPMRVRNGWLPKSKPSEFDDLAILSAFMSDTLLSWKLLDVATVPAKCDLDRFLMMFGKELKAMGRRSGRSQASKPPERPSSRGFSGSQREQIGMKRSIVLPFGGAAAAFAVDSLVEHLNDSKRDYIIQGQTNCGLSVHPKPHSLDYWLRQNFTTNRDTKQAVNEVIDRLVSTGLFEEGRFPCPDSGRMCKGIRLIAIENPE